MNCNFVRDNEYLVCSVCLTKIKTIQEPEKTHRKCDGAKQYPSTIQMGKNLISSMVSFAKDGFKTTDEEEQNRRLEICKGNQEKGIPTCPSYDKSQNRCVECGCFANFATAINSKHCPLGKW